MNVSLQLSVASFFLLFFSVTGEAHAIFNITEYGAVSDGETNSTEAVLAAWKDACRQFGKSEVLIPDGSFVVGPSQFAGPCNTTELVFIVSGSVVAPTNLSLFGENVNWLSFYNVDGLSVTGGGTFDGRGESAWPYNDCARRYDGKCNILPKSLTFAFITNSTIRDVSSVNSKSFHMHIFECKNLTLRGLNITAPADSPNTDGIHIANSHNVAIVDSVIGTGDDCISVGPENTNVTISGIYCGPGHGISVGSLGKGETERDVVGLTVTNCTLNGTDNGVRIKTWQSSPRELLAANFTFDDIVMNDVGNPIIIDQEYCPHENCDEQYPSLVKIRNVKYQRIRGESRSKVAIRLICSAEKPCEDIELHDIDLKYNGGDEGEEPTSSCSYAHGRNVGTVIPTSCL